MNTPVSFEIAKLLKEKGFDEPCRYVHDTWSNIKDWLEGGEGEHRNSHQNGSVYYSAPTIAEVVMWLYDEHGVWIEGMHCGTFNDFTFKVSRLNKKNIKKEPHYMHDLGKGFNSPTDAYRAAIEYTLKNLI